MATIEDEELDPNGVSTTRSFRSKMRNALDANDRPLFDANGNEIIRKSLSILERMYTTKEIVSTNG
ncbi:hypothetical protein ACV56Z_06390 [Staphylococcus aureus]